MLRKHFSYKNEENKEIKKKKKTNLKSKNKQRKAQIQHWDKWFFKSFFFCVLPFSLFFSVAVGANFCSLFVLFFFFFFEANKKLRSLAPSSLN
jgi:ABC-type multidrug transport system fused ATPase/permease subunit